MARFLPRKLLVFVVGFLIASVRDVWGQSEWSGFANAPGSLLDFSCSNNTVITGIASDFR